MSDSLGFPDSEGAVTPAICTALKHALTLKSSLFGHCDHKCKGTVHFLSFGMFRRGVFGVWGRASCYQTLHIDVGGAFMCLQSCLSLAYIGVCDGLQKNDTVGSPLCLGMAWFWWPLWLHPESSFTIPQSSLASLDWCSRRGFRLRIWSLVHIFILIIFYQIYDILK